MVQPIAIKSIFKTPTHPSIEKKSFFELFLTDLFSCAEWYTAVVTASYDGQSQGSTRPLQCHLLHHRAAGHALHRGLGEGGLGDGLSLDCWQGAARHAAAHLRPKH